MNQATAQNQIIDPQGSPDLLVKLQKEGEARGRSNGVVQPISPNRPGVALIALAAGVPAYTLLVIFAAIALFGGDVAMLKGIAWALDTTEHRMWLFLVTTTVAPVSAYLMSRAWAK